MLQFSDYRQHDAIRSLPFCHGSINTHCFTGNAYLHRHNPVSFLVRSLLDSSIHSVSMGLFYLYFFLPWFQAFHDVAVLLRSCPYQYFLLAASGAFAHEIILLETSFYSTSSGRFSTQTFLTWCCDNKKIIYLTCQWSLPVVRSVLFVGFFAYKTTLLLYSSLAVNLVFNCLRRSMAVFLWH